MKKRKKLLRKKAPAGLQYMHIISCICLVSGIGLFTWFVYVGQGDRDTQQAIIDPNGTVQQEVAEGRMVLECAHTHRLNGVCTTSTSTGQIVGVMVENHVDARPQAGLHHARVVYEAPVEGNITRFLALYAAEDDVAKIGPVRSARPYYLDWLAEYGEALYLHVGGSPEALERIENEGVFNLNEFYYGGTYFWRSSDRYAPHNTYTASNLWQTALERSWDGDAGEMDSWNFEYLEPCSEDEACVSSITTSYAPPAYAPTWVYDPDTMMYERHEGGYVHRDQDGNAIMVDTLIVQRVDVQVIDAVGRKQIDTVGEGEVMVYQRGHAIPGTWKKDTRTGRTEWQCEDGSPLPLAPGKIWVAVLGQDGTLQSE